MVAVLNSGQTRASRVANLVAASVAGKNKEQILHCLASLKAHGVINDYGNVYTDAKGFHFSVQPFYPILPYLKFDIAI